MNRLGVADNEKGLIARKAPGICQGLICKGFYLKKKKNHLIFISIVKKEKVFKNKQRMVDLSSF